MIRTLNKKECEKVLATNYIGNLSYIFKDRPFIVPITYFYNQDDNVIIGYSAEGHKINAMRKNDNVSFSVSDVDSINSWESVLARGSFKELIGSYAKGQLHAFSLGVKDLIMKKEHKKLDFISEFSAKLYTEDLPIVFHILVEEITGKIRRH